MTPTHSRNSGKEFTAEARRDAARYPSRSDIVQYLAQAGWEVCDCDEWSLAELRHAWDKEQSTA